MSVSTLQYWVARYRNASAQERQSGAWAADRPSTPHRQPTLCSERVHNRVCQTRQRTGWGPRLIASELEMSHATVWRCLRRRGLSRRPKREREEIRRFEWPCPGDLLQMDVKRFARFTRPGHRVTGDRYRSAKEKRNGPGWEFCHSIVDDHSRLAFSELHADEQAATVTAFVERALAFFAAHGITPKRLQTDNHFSYVHNRSLRELLAHRAIQHRRIPPRTPSATGRSRDTSRRSPASGPTDSATAQATPEPKRYPSGSATTTTAETTANSATGRPSAAFGTSRSRTTSGSRCRCGGRSGHDRGMPRGIPLGR